MPLQTMNKRHLATAIAAALLLGACDMSTELLEATDPDIISPEVITTPEAADALRIGALARLRTVTSGGESMWLLGGLLVDEWKSSDTFSQRNETDQRLVQESNGNVQGALRDVYRARTNAREALNALVQFAPNNRVGQSQMYFTIGFAELTLAENFCNGTPLSDASTGEIVYGPPMSNAEVFALALTHFDSALTLAGTDANARNMAAIGKARTLLNLGRFADAGTAVSGVPTNFRFDATFSLTAGNNQIWALNTSAKRWTVGDSFDITGVIRNSLPFASANDGRLPVTGATLGANTGVGKGFDGQTNFVFQRNYGRTDPTPIISGVDARLIEAEARLQANDIPGMMTILNALRGSPQVLGSVTSPVLAPLTQPASRDAAIDLLFREKAFWTFGRGQRLMDLRRLVRQYQRPQDQVFPVGPFFKNGVYGPDMNFPVTVDEQNNENFAACTDRNA
jgi:starch-binding outer membrane protein, SusD/RagB family